MKTYNRICLKDFVIDKDFKLKRGEEYLTSEEEKGYVTVFTSPYWVGNVPVKIFGGEVRFT